MNENSELKKRLENLELNNKNLIEQLGKLQFSLNEKNLPIGHKSTESSNENGSDVTMMGPLCINSSPSSTNSTNQFGMLLLVLVLFFAVLLGIWSPLVSKDQISNTAANTAAAAAASATSSSSFSIMAATTNRNQGSLAANKATAAVVAAAATAAASLISIKSESTFSTSRKSSESESECIQTIKVAKDGEHSNTNVVSVGSPSPFVSTTTTSNLKTKIQLCSSSNDEEMASLEANINALDQLKRSNSPINLLQNDSAYLSINGNSNNHNSNNNNNNGLTARSKTGTAVELTKVRPFIRKLPLIQKANASGSIACLSQTSQSTPIKSGSKQNICTQMSSLKNSGLSEFYIINGSGEDSPIVVLNLPTAAASNSNLNSNNNNNSHELDSASSNNLGAISTATIIDNSLENKLNSLSRSSQLYINSNVNSLPITLLANKSAGQLNGATANNYRIINTSTAQLSNQQKNTANTNKLPTRFRLVNNAIGNVGNPNNYHSITPSLIKLNSSS
jgi:hypothetical protein